MPTAMNPGGAERHTTSSTSGIAASSARLSGAPTGIASTTDAAPSSRATRHGDPRGRPGGDPVVDDHRGAPGEVDRRRRHRGTGAPAPRAPHAPAARRRRGPMRRRRCGAARRRSARAPRARRWRPSRPQAAWGARACARRARRAAHRAPTRAPPRRARRRGAGRARRVARSCGPRTPARAGGPRRVDR